MNKMAKNYIYNVAYQFFVIIVPLITAPYLARVLHAENIGIYSYVTSWASMINTIGLLGLYNYGNRQVAYVREDQNKLNDVFSELLSLRSILCIISTVIYAIVACSSEFKVYFLLYYPWLLTGFFDISWFYTGIEDMGPMVLKNFAIKMLNVIGIFLLVKSENDLGKYLGLVAVVTLCANVSMYWKIKDRVTRWYFSLKNSWSHIRGAVLLFLPQLASMFYLQVDKIMLQYITQDEKQLAFYDQAEKIVNIPFTLITALSVVMMPRIANEFQKGHLATIKSYVIKAAHFSMLISIPMFVGLNAIGDNFIPWYLGDEYLPVIKILSIVSFIILSNSLVNISGTQYFTAVDKSNVLTLSNVIAAIANIVINSFLIPLWGCYGAAVATVLSSTASVFIQFYFLNRDISIKYIFKGAWKYVLSAIIMYWGVKICSSVSLHGPLMTFMQIAVGCIVYLGILGLLREQTLVEIIHYAMSKVFRKKGSIIDA